MPGLPPLCCTRLYACFSFARSHTSSINRSVPAGLSVSPFAAGASVPCVRGRRASLGARPVKASSNWIFCRWSPTSPAPSALPSVRAFGLRSGPDHYGWLPRAGPNLPSADFCAAFGSFLPSRQADHKGRGRPRRRPPEVSSTAFSAQPPDLRSAPLMDMDFAVECLLVRRSRLLSGFCPSARAFAPRFFQTQPRGCSPCVSLPFTSIRLVGDFHPELSNMLGTH
jgi:hypothetical protein